MGIRLPVVTHAKQIIRESPLIQKKPSPVAMDVPKGYFTVYLGENQKRRYVVPLSYLSQPSFQDLLSQAEAEFGFNHPMGGLTIPCEEEVFLNLTSHQNKSCDK